MFSKNKLWRVSIINSADFGPPGTERHLAISSNVIKRDYLKRKIFCIAHVFDRYICRLTFSNLDHTEYIFEFRLILFFQHSSHSRHHFLIWTFTFSGDESTDFWSYPGVVTQTVAAWPRNSCFVWTPYQPPTLPCTCTDKGSQCVYNCPNHHSVEVTVSQTACCLRASVFCPFIPFLHIASLDFKTCAKVFKVFSLPFLSIIN